MNERELHKISLQSVDRWRAVDGNNTLALDYDLNEDSVVIEFGGFKGVWVDMLINKHGFTPNLYIFEPVGTFYDILVEKYKDNPKIQVFNYGVSDVSKKATLHISVGSGDGTSEFTTELIKNVNSVDVEFITMNEALQLCDVDYVDMAQINIEGGEYGLLESMLASSLVSKFGSIQIQFHVHVPNADTRRLAIQEGFKKVGFTNLFDFPFNFEAWTRV